MNFSIDSCIILITKSIPPSTPTAKLMVSSRCAKRVMVFWATCDAMMRRREDGIPRGHSLVRSSGFLYRQKRHVSVHSCWMGSGIKLLYIKSNRVCKSSLTSLICMAAKSMNRSSKSQVAPDAFFLEPRNILLQTLPGSWWR